MPQIIAHIVAWLTTKIVLWFLVPGALLLIGWGIESYFSRRRRASHPPESLGAGDVTVPPRAGREFDRNVNRAERDS